VTTHTPADRAIRPAIAFLRPHLGIGGAERLVLDAATQYQARRCDVRFFVPDACTGPQFSEVTTGLVAITSVRPLAPLHLGGRLRAPLALARTTTAARCLAGRRDRTDLVFCDVVAHVIPYVKRKMRCPVVYYCHFPDVLLTSDGARDSAAYGWYRRLIDAREESGVLAADRVLVNSAFTASVVRDWLPGLPVDRLQVVHPGVPIPAAPVAMPKADADSPISLLSISRFDPRKNVPLAVDALAALRPLVPRHVFERVRLVLAGHFDDRLPEQRVLLDHLRARAATLGVGKHLAIELSPSSAARDALIAASRCVIYTPAAEHFGYVPVEAMGAARPVVAANQGGPSETIVDGKTGCLRPPTAAAFAEAIRTYVMDAAEADRVGRAGAAHVARHFSIEAFGNRLWAATSPLLEAR
jgi:alpha-1,3/alpha-1,6-mannosyltransferase